MCQAEGVSAEISCRRLYITNRDPLPVEPVVPNYATPDKKGEFQAHWALRVMLLAGIAAFFVPLAEDDTLSALAVKTIRSSQRSSMTSESLAVGAAVFGCALALPLFLLAIVLANRRTLSALIQHGSLVVCSLALAGCGAIILFFFSTTPDWRYDIPILESLSILPAATTSTTFLIRSPYWYEN
jgi:hypothetical protein